MVLGKAIHGDVFDAVNYRIASPVFISVDKIDSKYIIKGIITVGLRLPINDATNSVMTPTNPKIWI